MRYRQALATDAEVSLVAKAECLADVAEALAIMVPWGLCHAVGWSILSGPQKPGHPAGRRAKTIRHA